MPEPLKPLVAAHLFQRLSRGEDRETIADALGIHVRTVDRYAAMWGYVGDRLTRQMRRADRDHDAETKARWRCADCGALSTGDHCPNDHRAPWITEDAA